jgi:hypothetical protein
MVYWYLTESLNRVDDEKALKTFVDLANEQLSINCLELLRYQCKDSRSEIFYRRQEELESKLVELLNVNH